MAGRLLYTLMRFGLAQQLALLLSGAVVISTLAMGGLMAWSLRNGFADYTRAREEQSLDRFVGLIERHAQNDPELRWLRGNREAMRALIDEQDELSEGRRRPPRPPRDEAPLAPPDAGEFEPPPPLRREAAPPPPHPGTLAGRVQIFDRQHQWVAGRPPSPGDTVVTHEIKVRGEVVGYASLNLRPEPGDADSAFLHKQYARLAGLTLATLMLTLLTSGFIARRWSRPLKAVQTAARRIARGDFSVRLQPRGASEIAALMADVNVMAQTLAAQEGSRRGWIAQVSHELRTPLAVLQGELESIEDGVRQVTPELLANLREEVLRLGRLVNDLHTLALADMGELKCVLRDGDADEALLRCCRRFEVQAQRKGLRLEWPAPGPSIPVHWDFGRIDQMLGNLLENSLRYTHAPGLVKVSWQSSPLGFRLSVEDSPPGVAAEHLPRLFEALYRTDSARQRQGSVGSGLGLAIARAIAVAHRGRIEARPSPLGGLSMTVDLPLDAS